MEPSHVGGNRSRVSHRRCWRAFAGQFRTRGVRVRPVVVTHVVPEYRVPMFQALRERYPELRVFTSVGGSWATGRNAAGLESLGGYDIFEARTVRIGGVSLVRFPGLRRAVTQADPDVLLLDSRMGLLSVWPLAVFPPRVSGHRIPTVWWFAGWRNRERPRIISMLAEGIQSLVIRRGTGAACYSGRARALAIKLGIPEDRAVVIQNATDTSLLQAAFESMERRASDSPEPLRLLYVGSVEQRKRLDVVVDAIGRPGLIGATTLRVVGDGPATDELRVRARDRGVDSWVEFVPGTHEPSLVAQHLAWTDVGVLPNQGGLFLNTAMSCGLPVVCGRADGTEEDLVEDGVTGWRLMTTEPRELAAILTQLHANRSEITRVGLSAQRRYQSMATISHMIDGIDLAISRALSAVRAGVDV